MDDSGQALPRRPQYPVYRCFLSDLAGFTSLRRVGPSPQRPPTAIWAQWAGLWEEFNPAVADCGCRAPLAPHLVRPPSHSMFTRQQCQLQPNPDQGTSLLPTANPRLSSPQTTSHPRVNTRHSHTRPPARHSRLTRHPRESGDPDPRLHNPQTRNCNETRPLSYTCGPPPQPPSSPRKRGPRPPSP